jgi:hypothetical protein
MFISATAHLPAKTTKIRKARNHAIRMQREAAGKAIFDRNIRKEREIGVHPQHLNSYRRLWVLSPAEWMAQSRAWDKANPIAKPLSAA